MLDVKSVMGNTIEKWPCATESLGDSINGTLRENTSLLQPHSKLCQSHMNTNVACRPQGKICTSTLAAKAVKT